MFNPPIRLLFIANYPKGWAPGQRFRFDCYLSYFKKQGVHVTYTPIMNEEEYRNYTRSSLTKLKVYFKQFFIRLKDLLRKNRYDIIFIQREASFFPWTWFDTLFEKGKAKVIYDFDDAIWLPQSGATAPWLARHKKIPALIQNADVVIAGCPYLAEYARQYHSWVEIIPTVVDTDYFVPKKKEPKYDYPVVIGWSGSPSTLKENFMVFEKVWIRVKETLGDKVVFKVMGGDFYHNERLGIHSIAFDPDKEVDFIGTFDIGVKPLPENDWTKGKCGLKELIYMSMEIPAIVSPVGATADSVDHGVNGFHATTEEEWVHYIKTLVENHELRWQMGKAAREKVVQKFSVKAWRDYYIKLFHRLLNSPKT